MDRFLLLFITMHILKKRKKDINNHIEIKNISLNNFSDQNYAYVTKDKIQKFRSYDTGILL